ncbi:MAG: hypothetical protein M5U26_08485 [Planctomycetota bacterium]|nr:hypothetical protein [Planctomycetota bacterium]
MNLTADTTKGLALFENLETAFRQHDNESDNFVAGVFTHLPKEFSATEADEWASYMMFLRELGLEGSQGLEVRNETGGTLAAGTLVYVSGYGSDKWLISKADPAALASLAQYVLAADLDDDEDGFAYAYRTVAGLDTSGTSEGDPVYLSGTPGEFVFTPPGGSDIEQKVGTVEVVDNADGAIRFTVGGEGSFLRSAMTGSGTAGAIPRFDSATVLENGSLLDDGAVYPTSANAVDLGKTSAEFRGAYLGEDSGSGTYYGLDQDWRFAYDESASDSLILYEGTVPAIFFKGSDPGSQAAASDTNGNDLWIRTQTGGAHVAANPSGGNLWLVPGAAGAGGSGSVGTVYVGYSPSPGTDYWAFSHNGGTASAKVAGGAMLFATVGSDDVNFGIANLSQMALSTSAANTTILGRSGKLSVKEHFAGDDSSSGYVLGIDANGRIYYDEATTDRVHVIGAKWSLFTPATNDPTVDFLIYAAATTQTPLAVQAQAAQTANLFELQNSSATVLALFDSGANLNMQDLLITRPVLKDYGETLNAIGSIGGGTQDIDLTLGNVVSGTVDTSTTTFTFSNPSTSGVACSFSLVLTNGGSQTVNWPASVDWPNGVAPTLTAAGVDVLTFLTLDGGTTWYGFVAGLDLQ